MLLSENIRRVGMEPREGVRRRGERWREDRWNGGTVER